MKSAIIYLLLTLNTITYQPDELTNEILTSRTADTLIIEQCEGVALNDIDGVITNTSTNYNYISYRDVDAKPGEAVTTYCIYNPYTQYEDDILYRIDVVEDGNIYIN